MELEQYRTGLFSVSLSIFNEYLILETWCLIKSSTRHVLKLLPQSGPFPQSNLKTVHQVRGPERERLAGPWRRVWPWCCSSPHWPWRQSSTAERRPPRRGWGTGGLRGEECCWGPTEVGAGGRDRKWCLGEQRRKLIEEKKEEEGSGHREEPKT